MKEYHWLITVNHSLNILVLNVPDEGISRNECTQWRYIQKWMYPMKVYPEMNVPNEGISRNECTQWRYIKKCIVCTKFDIFDLNSNGT